MLDPYDPQPLNLHDCSSYISSCLELTKQRLKDFDSIQQVIKAEDELNAYPRLGSLEPPRDIFVIDEDKIPSKDLNRARHTLLDGGVFLEHACAGEATRLSLGTKYLINPRIDLSPKNLGELLGEDYKLDVQPGDLRHISLGRRHMLQLAWDLSKLAEESGKDPAQVLKKQNLLIIVNETSYRPVLEDFLEAGFYGFARRNILFLVQKSFHGITLRDGLWIYDTSSPRRLHNHGQMLMQTSMDRQVFRLDESNQPDYVTWAEFRQILGDFDDKVSFNIEDLDYLDQSLDLVGLATALTLSGQGARMVMEVVANNPDNPQKGGLLAWDTELKRNVMIESFQLADMPNEQITHLNRNINHYPHPAMAATAVRDYGLAMPIKVKKNHIYFQPVQGDVNFLVNTAFVRRSKLKPISAWKSGAETPAALNAMHRQETRPGFIKWAEELTGINL